MSAEAGFVPQGKLPVEIPNLMGWWNATNLDTFEETAGEVTRWNSVVNGWYFYNSDNSAFHRKQLYKGRWSYYTDPAYESDSIFSIDGKRYNGGTAVPQATAWTDQLNASQAYTMIACVIAYDDSDVPTYIVIGDNSFVRFSGIGTNISGSTKRWRFNPTVKRDGVNYEPRFFPNIEKFGEPVVIALTVDGTVGAYGYVDGGQIGFQSFNQELYTWSTDLADNLRPARILADSSPNAKKGNVFAAAFYDRALTQTEIQELTEYFLDAYTRP